MPGHRPVAAAVTYGLGSDLAARFLQMAFLEGAPRPFTGAARPAYHAEVLLTVGWPVALALLATCVFRPDRHGATTRGWAIPLAPVLAWVGVGAGHVAAFPIDGRATSKILLGAELACLAWGAVAAWRSWRGPAWSGPHGVALFLLGTEFVVVLLGPFATNIYTDWVVARVIYTASFLALAAWEWMCAAPRAPARP